MNTEGSVACCDLPQSGPDGLKDVSVVDRMVRWLDTKGDQHMEVSCDPSAAGEWLKDAQTVSIPDWGVRLERLTARRDRQDIGCQYP